jgi:hypothetical protein
MSGPGNGTYTVPYAVVTATDRGGQLLIVNIVTLTLSVISFCLRIYIANRENRSGLRIYKDDILCFAGTVRCPSSPPGSGSLTAVLGLLHHPMWADMGRCRPGQRQGHQSHPSKALAPSRKGGRPVRNVPAPMLISGQAAICHRHFLYRHPLSLKGERHIPPRAVTRPRAQADMDLLAGHPVAMVRSVRVRRRPQVPSQPPVDGILHAMHRPSKYPLHFAASLTTTARAMAGH